MQFENKFIIILLTSSCCVNLLENSIESQSPLNIKLVYGFLIKKVQVLALMMFIMSMYLIIVYNICYGNEENKRISSGNYYSK